MTSSRILLGAILLPLLAACAGQGPGPEVPATADVNRRTELREAAGELRANPDTRRAGAELGRVDAWLEDYRDIVDDDPELAELYLDAVEATLAQVKSHAERVAAERAAPMPAAAAPAAPGELASPAEPVSEMPENLVAPSDDVAISEEP